jgi:glucosamine--fructose-6-phosphate aminotransferase (isomerizing)
MCGIFGYVGNKTNAAELILEGLKTLEYRGYDSWGIAVRPQKEKKKRETLFTVEKHLGKIGNAILGKTFTAPSSLAIGQTRWATHGGVTVENAHPHLDCTNQISLVHNGIIENFSELKQMLIANDHVFHSQTDTEVAVHLIEEYLKKDGFATAVRKAFNDLRGMNAIVVAYASSKEIIAAKTGSPLVVGISGTNYYVASDASGIVPYTKKVIFLEDHQMVILGEKMELLSLPNGNKVTPTITTLDWEFENAEKGIYPHFLVKEINEQPRVIENIALTYKEQTMQLAKLIENAFGTFMLGCGTASHAALAGTYLFSSIARHHVNFSIGSEFEYLEGYLTPQTLVIPISQSGETIDVVVPVEKAKKKGSKIAAIVNVLGSTLYRQADHPILLGAGQEKAVIATKSFMAMYAVLLFTAYTLAQKQSEASDLLLQASENIKKLLTDTTEEKIVKLASDLKDHEHIYVLGRGLSYAAALEATLKIKETSYVHAEGFAGGELKHGVMALIEEGTPCIIFAPNDETYDEILSNAQEVKARGAYIIGIGPRENAVFDIHFKTADLKEATLLPQILIAQLFAYHLALSRGNEDPDKPRNLAKSVTVK